MEYFDGNADEDKELITIEELSQRLVSHNFSIFIISIIIIIRKVSIKKWSK